MANFKIPMTEIAVLIRRRLKGKAGHRNDWSGQEEKEKIKPGYKKKIQWAVNEKRRKTKRAENRARGRAERKAKRQTF